jgi:hypothetical protein
MSARKTRRVQAAQSGVQVARRPAQVAPRFRRGGPVGHADTGVNRLLEVRRVARAPQQRPEQRRQRHDRSRGPVRQVEPRRPLPGELGDAVDRLAERRYLGRQDVRLPDVAVFGRQEYAVGDVVDMGHRHAESSQGHHRQLPVTRLLQLRAELRRVAGA